jgi:hypothetical protein
MEMKIKWIYVAPAVESRRVALEGVLAGTFKSERMKSLQYIDGYDEEEVSVSEDITIIF